MSAARDAATEIVRTLRDAGHTAYFAGGCVRDECLGLDPKDYDVATDARPERVRRLFRNVNEVGASFGVMLVRTGGGVVEVATFRTEGAYSDKRRPDEVRYADAPSDAKRRDFTINALFLDPLAPPEPVGPDDREVRGAVIDHVGGKADLARRVLRAVGDPERRLAEDHLRALRAVRIASRLGFEIDAATALAIRRHASELAGISRERVGDEVRLMLGHESRADAVALLDELGLSGPALEEAESGAGDAPALLRALGGERSMGGLLACWAIGRLGAAPGRRPAPGVIRDGSGAVVTRWRRALCLSNDERTRMGEVVRGVATLLDVWPGAGVAAQKRMAASGWFPDALAIVRAIDPREGDAIERAVERLRSAGGGLAPAPLVDGADLLRLRSPGGPWVGRLLEALYDMQLEGRLADRESALREAERRVKDA